MGRYSGYIREKTLEKNEKAQNQINFRKLAQRLGGIGPCGLPCCCRRFLETLPEISEEEEKKLLNKGNPATVTGLCGQIKCCLLFGKKLPKPSLPSKPSTPSLPSPSLPSPSLPSPKPSRKFIRKIVKKRK